MKTLTGYVLLLTSFIILGAINNVDATNKKNNTNTNTRVRGNVYDQTAGVPIGGLSVSVTCNGITKTSSTDGNGLYVVDFTKAECDKFAPVTASATFNSENQNQSVLVSSTNTATMDLNFGLIAVPEFGLVTGVISALGSGVAFLGLRRKFTH